jgi:hypothetical protein
VPKSLRTLIFVFMTACTALPYHAIGITDLDGRAVNYDTSFYDPSGDCNADPTTAGGGNVTLSGGDHDQQAFNYLITNLGLQPFQSAAIVGNLEHESGLVTTAVNSTSGAYGIAQWLGGRLDGPKGIGLKATEGGSYSKLGNQLDFVKVELNGGFKSALSAVKADKTIEQATTDFELQYEKAGVNEANIPARIAFAKKVLAKYGNGAPPASTTAAGGTSTNPCDATLTSATGNSIVDQALKFVWPSPACTQTYAGEHRTSCSVSTSAYHKAYDGGGGGETDCGAFVGTVMHASKADPNYPDANTVAGHDYVEAHQNKYQINQHPTATSQLHPGDILIYGGHPPEGHTMIYVGPGQKGGYTRADASLGGHTPQLNTPGGVIWIMQQPGTISATLKSGPSNVTAL